MEIKILFEDDDVVVVNKPYGIMVHEDGHTKDETIVDWFLSHAPQARGVGESQTSPQGEVLERSGVVHRLDAETTGVLVLAKTKESYEHLKKQFHDRLTKKEYRAFVYGHMREKWGTIDRPIGRSAKDFRLKSAQRGAKGTLREAETNWELVGKGEYEGEPFSYMKLMPKTGRTHQIRVHMKSVDRPIVCDTLYAGSKCETSNNLGLNRLALHAHTLELILPNGELQRFIAPLPQEFEDAAERIAQ
ncbi:RluA family pseudouridine synthase [Candidatus Pacebacteria bacterium]|nr:RluA family pseudouridine synthase [Candidatus Paceibacterota bacterium]